MTNTKHKLVEADVNILVVSDNSSDAELIRELLAPEYGRVFLSIDPDLAVEDFEHRAPNVLVLAFDTLDKSEQYYLNLYRLSEKIHLLPHRTVILCKKEEVNRAYQACKKNYFDDYILFWPITFDAPRLLMSMHHALRELIALRVDQPSAAEFAAQARKLSDLGTLIDRQMALGDERIELTQRAIKRAELEIGGVLDVFAKNLARKGLLDVFSVKNIPGLEREIVRLKTDEIGQRLHTLAKSLPPLRQWAEKFKKECEPHIRSASALNAMADRIWPTILVVDDEDFQRKIVCEMLAAANYRVVAATGGVEALNILSKLQPDLILMDIMMPDMDGIETTRRIKTVAQLVDVPIIMVTGHRSETAVTESMKAGAANFVIKPFDRESLLSKVSLTLKL